jgi:hypothetical protein
MQEEENATMRNTVSTLLAAVTLAGVAGGAFADDVKVTGGFELGYTYNFNKPGTRTNRYIFNGRDSTVPSLRFPRNRRPRAMRASCCAS